MCKDDVHARWLTYIDENGWIKWAQHVWDKIELLKENKEDQNVYVCVYCGQRWIKHFDSWIRTLDFAFKFCFKSFKMWTFFHFKIK